MLFYEISPEPQFLKLSKYCRRFQIKNLPVDWFFIIFADPVMLF
jgi:hypothetical protein